MKSGELIKVGDTLELYTNEGDYEKSEEKRLEAKSSVNEWADSHVYKTKVEDIVNGLYQVGIPSRGWIHMVLHTGDRLYMAVSREVGIYLCHVLVEEIVKQGNIRYALLKQASEMRKIQRREFYRLSLRVGVDVYDYIEGSEYILGVDYLADIDNKHMRDELTSGVALEITKTGDISVTGLSFTTKRRYEIGDKLLLKIHFEEVQKDLAAITLCAEILRVSYEEDSGISVAGVRFFSLADGATDFLNKFVVKEQHNRIKQRRTMED